MRAALAALALIGCQPAHAQAPEACAPSIDEARTLLAEKYGEVSVGYGLDVDGGFVIEVFVSEHGSYTVLKVEPDGRSCVIQQGYERTFVEMPWPKAGTDG